MSEATSSHAFPTRILIVGGGGFAGRHLQSHLLASPSNVPLQITTTVLPPHPTPSPASLASTQERGRVQAESSPSPSEIPLSSPPLTKGREGWGGEGQRGEVKSVELDICDEKAVAAVVKEVKPHHIYHLAARASGADTDRDAIFAVNVEGTRNVLDAAANISPFPRVLVISTGYVYGETTPERPARENDPIGPLWKYGAYTDSKIEMESVARSYRGFTLIARAFAHTGPGQEPRFAIPSFARQLAHIERGQDPPALKVGNLMAQRDLLDVRDVVCAYRLLMQHGDPGQVYNIALGKPVTMLSLLERLRSFCSVETEVQSEAARLRPSDILCSTGDAFALRALTGWKPQYTLDDTLRDTLDYWRSITD